MPLPPLRRASRESSEGLLRETRTSNVLAVAPECEVIDTINSIRNVESTLLTSLKPLVPEKDKELDVLPSQSGHAWSERSVGPTYAAGAGPLLQPYRKLTDLTLTLRPNVCGKVLENVALRPSKLNLSIRIGALGADGEIAKAYSAKVQATWPSSASPFALVVASAPLAALAACSPLGVVACRFKIWQSGSVKNNWLGKTQPLVVPAAQHRVEIGSLDLFFEARQGPPPEQIQQSISRVQLEWPDACAGHQPTRAPQNRFSEVMHTSSEELVDPAELGSQIVNAIGTQQWGIAAALLHALQTEDRAFRQAVLATTDSARRNALRLAVEGIMKPTTPSALKALEDSTLTVVMATRRPYWWSLKIHSVCGTSFAGKVSIGLPKSPFGCGVQPSAVMNKSRLEWKDCRWSEGYDVDGSITLLGPDGSACGEVAEGSPTSWATTTMARLSIANEGELILSFVKPGEQFVLLASQEKLGSNAVFGHLGTGPRCLNPMPVPMLTARGTLAGSPAHGVFDLATCGRLCWQGEDYSASDVAGLAAACGCDPRAIAHDGYSAFTTAVLWLEDTNIIPTLFNERLDLSVLPKLRENEPTAWLNWVSKQQSLGAPQMDLVAAGVRRELPVLYADATLLLRHCLTCDLPLVAARVVERIDGQRVLLEVMDRAACPRWLQVAQIILSREIPHMSICKSHSTLLYAIDKVRSGQLHFQILVEACLAFVREERRSSQKPLAFTSLSSSAECPICFEALCRTTAVAFVDHSERAVCSHYVCAACAKGCQATSAHSGTEHRCPECRRTAQSVAVIPSLRKDPVAWFDFLHGNPNGSVPRSTLLRTIAAQLPFDEDTLEEALDKNPPNTSLLHGQDLGKRLWADVDFMDFLTSGLYSWLWIQEGAYAEQLQKGDDEGAGERKSSKESKQADITNDGGRVLASNSLGGGSSSSDGAGACDSIHSRFGMPWVLGGHRNSESRDAERTIRSGGVGRISSGSSSSSEDRIVRGLILGQVDPTSSSSIRSLDGDDHDDELEGLAQVSGMRTHLMSL